MGFIMRFFRTLLNRPEPKIGRIEAEAIARREAAERGCPVTTVRVFEELSAWRVVLWPTFRPRPWGVIDNQTGTRSWHSLPR